MKRRHVAFIAIISMAAILIVAVVAFAVFYHSEYPQYKGIAHYYEEIGKGPYPAHYREEEIEKGVYPFTFVFFGDNRPAVEDGKFEQPEIFIDMIQKINEENPLFVIGGGDFVAVGDLGTLLPEDLEVPEEFTGQNAFDKFKKVVDNLEAPLFYVCGNHDHPGYEEFLEKEKVYAFTYENSLFVILDNSFSFILEMNEEQLAFLEEQLKKEEFEHKFVFIHVPPFYPEGYHKPGLFQEILDRIRSKIALHKMRYPERFMEIVCKYNVDYVFSSHIHGFFEDKIDSYEKEIDSCEKEKCSTIFITSGGAGAPLTEEEGYYHYIVVEVGDTITYRVVRCDAQNITLRQMIW